MAGDRSFDCVIIGGGHNGLITAAYLARSGRTVCVVERRAVLGGCAVTEPLWPGYRVSTAAYVVSLLSPSIIRDLKLTSYGFEILPRRPSSFTPLLDGRSLTMGPDLAATCKEIAQFSARDAERYPAYLDWLETVASAVEPLIESVAPNPLPLPSDWRRRGWGQRLGDLKTLWGLYGMLEGLGERLPETVELLAGAVRPLLERWFEAEVLRATLATDGIIGAFASISSPGTAYVLLHHVMGKAGGARGVWGYIRGGMGGLADALERACRDLGVTILREEEVTRIVTSGRRVEGVLTQSRRYLRAPVVASSVDAQWTFLRFVEPEDLPEGFRRAVERIDYSSASAKINLALGGLPRFRALRHMDGSTPPPPLHGTIHIAPTLDYIERAYADAICGRPSEEPVLEITLPSTVDPTLAPEGKHVMSMFVQYAPYKLRDASWDDIKEAFADRCVEVLERYAPGIGNLIEHRQVLSPLDLERTFRLTGGNIMQGAMPLHQLYACRPVVGWADHRTPIEGLYVCGAAAHPGGGVCGIAGRNAARIIEEDWQRRR